MMSEEISKPIFYAHSKDGEDKQNWQRLITHLTKTAHFAETFGIDAGVAELARIAALLHDLGKFSHEFQQRLEGKKIRVDHSTAGGKELYQAFKGTSQEPLATLLAYCIVGHHTGLPNYGDSSDLPGDGSLVARLKTEIYDYSAYKKELDLSTLKFPEQLNLRPIKNNWGFSFSFLTRMIYSALVDADFQETQTYVQGKKPRGNHASIETLCKKFNIFLQKFDNPQREIDQKRTSTLRVCITKASLKPGLFTLTVPTGGGKTLSSMAFALNHAVKHKLKRIIYVIPFTTIIEQNASIFKEVLGDENVLEHHSNFDWEQKRLQEIETPDNQTNSIYQKLKLASENWDIPIIVTTNVQFFESLFANRSSRCRKLHNIANSVIIFDEAQMFPRDYMLPAMYSVWELVTNYGASAIFCTATQPNLERFMPVDSPMVELVPDPQELFDFYKRVELVNLGKLNDEELLKRLGVEHQALCIVNTRRHAKGLFDGLPNEGSFHLSTLMCPAHRKKTLAQIRKRLADSQPCRVVSTSVMEAGIDLDFPLGYRALAGLDSINQAAGRVNREMLQTSGKLFVFEVESPFVKRIPKFIAQNAEVARSVIQEYSNSPISIPAIQAYFDNLYSLKDKHDFDIKNILSFFNKSQPYIFEFSNAAQNFRVIEDNTVAVIIPFDQEANRLIEELINTPYPLSTLRKLQPYIVNIYENEFNSLSSKGVILTIADAYPVLNNADYYHSRTGLVVPDSGDGNALFF